MRFVFSTFLFISTAFMTLTGHAEDDVIKVRLMGSDLATEIATATVHACRDRGYQVSAVVVDRAGDVIAIKRDTLARRHTMEIAERKAGLVIMSGVSSGQMLQNRGDIRQELNHMEGIIVMDGAHPVEAVGNLIGAVGVSGAPGGDLDAECAAAGIETVQDKLDFAE